MAVDMNKPAATEGTQPPQAEVAAPAEETVEAVQRVCVNCGAPATFDEDPGGPFDSQSFCAIHQPVKAARVR